MTDQEKAVEALDKELGEKLSQDEYCLLNTTYAMVEDLADSKLGPGLDHLFAAHHSVESAELSLAIMRFMVYVGTLEERLFREHGIAHERRYDVAAGAEDIRVVEEALLALRTTLAAAEGQHHVRH